KYGNNWQVDDAIADEILDDLLKTECEKQQHVKYDKGKGHLKDDKRKVTGIKILDYLELMIENVEKLSIDDILKSSSEDTCSSDATWEQKKASKDEHRTVYKCRPRSSSTSAATIKLEKPKSRSMSKHLLVEKLFSSKHLAPRTPRIRSTSTTLLALAKRPPPVRNFALGLAAVKTWQQILNKEFGIKKVKEDVGGSSDVSRKGKRKIL
ncbi:hypothetical protein Tco_0252844, partial [Tanacetum coccineum]